VNAIGGTLGAGQHTATASIVSGPGGFVGPATCTYTGGSATANCHVTITSSASGTTVISATSDIPVNGETITRTTGTAANSASGGSDNASKSWAAARIQITPASATNEVGHEHTFTVTLSKDSGTGSFVPAPGEHVSVTLADTLGASHSDPTGSCTTAGPNTDANGQCTITFVSLTAGKVTGHATATLMINGASITVSTDGVAPNSADAVKTFVDANVQIAPASATNPTGTNHVLTVTVNAVGGLLDAGQQTATASIVSGPGSFVGSPTCTYTGGAATATCTVTISSGSTGTTVVAATADVPVNGVTITRATGTATNTTSGGSDNASKTWVDANVRITPPSAINPVGKNHVLTITVNAVGGTLGAGQHTATASIVSGPGSFVGSPTCTYTGGAATATCTVTIASAATGTTVVSATAGIPVNGVTITRTTGTAANTASGGSANASKLWADASVRTDVLGASGVVVTSVVSGTLVHDKVFVDRLAGTPAGVPAPSGSVVFHRFASLDCSGASVDQTVALLVGAPSTGVSDDFAPTGNISYRADYLGDVNYPARAGACEPLTVTPAPAPAIAIVKNPKSQTVAVGGTATSRSR